MKICESAVAGTLESSDLFVEVEPSEEFSLWVSSSAIQFRDAIEQHVRGELNKLNVTNGQWRITDSGALDCIITARVQATALRGAKQQVLPWEKIV
ncbi:citrate lyase acyl carrier protein [Vibrio artabrorum]|uniref:Citrate lyase acyl carrier protein n=1 Tax=Vibrio artabrorum TaxID=446374 RepID=A0ABT8CJY2_9VIBR|nr:citrate lyase acyl carrier protein [Vibrio artabrorum]MDN3701769.1 citrate lyase acyl carrier protein [Vibrio artabrorum]